MKHKIVGVIPAAGKGTRLKPYPGPKELFPVGYQNIKIDGKISKRPKVISQYLLENMIRAGIEKCYIIISEGKEQIMEYYGNGHLLGADICYLFQDDINGMAGALNLLQPWIKDEIVLLGMPDTVIEPKDAFKRLLKAHLCWEADLTLGLFYADNPSKFGMVKIDKNNNVVYHIDKPKKTDLKLLWGNACWSESFNRLLAEYMKKVAPKQRKKEIILGDVFGYALSKKMKVKGLIYKNGSYTDIGTYEELKVALERYT